MDRSKWEYKKLGEVCKSINAGGTPSRGNSAYWNGDIPWVKIKDMNSKYVNSTEEFITEEGLKNSSAKLFEPGTILYSIFATIGAASILEIPATTNQAIAGIVLGKGCDRDFYYYYLTSLKSHFENVSKGVAQNNINLSVLRNQKVIVPPLEDQQRIVAELDCLNEMIAIKQEQLKEFDKLAQSIFYDMFGDPVSNEKGWETNSMSKVCIGIGDGLHGTPQYDADGKIAFINGNNLIDGKIVITERTQFVNENEAKKIYVELDSNTILLSINGTLGKTAIYNNERVVLGKSACYLRLGNLLNVRFVMALMNTDEFLHFLENNSSQSTIKNVGLKAIRNYKIIIPTLELQQQFADKISAIEAQKELVKQSIAETQKLLDYTMDKYFG